MDLKRCLSFDLPNFGIASTDPGAILFEAYIRHSNSDFTFYDFIKSIDGEPMMKDAVNQCLYTAVRNANSDVQMAFLKAAHMGMRLSPRFDTSKFVDACRILRVINQLQRIDISASFHDFNINLIIDKLISRNHWPLAIEVCKFMEISLEDGIYRILAHWCLYIMDAYKNNKTSTISEEMVARKIFDRLKEYPSISYADIAEVAARNKLLGLATILLEKEKQMSRQVSVLLKLDQTEKALKIAIQSQQPDLMHLVLRRMRETKTNQEIELFIRRIPQMYSLYQNYIFEEVPDRALVLYEQSDDFIRQAIYHLKKAQECNDFFDTTKMREFLSNSNKALQLAKYSAPAELILFSAQLIFENNKAEEKYSVSLTDKTLRETFIWASENDHQALLESLKKQHRLSDKQYCAWKIEGLLRGRKMQLLDNFIKSKKGSINFMALVETCCKYNQYESGIKFIQNIGSYEDQIKAYLMLGETKKAVSMAMEKSDKSLLQAIRRKMPINSQKWVEVSSMIQSIS